MSFVRSPASHIDEHDLLDVLARAWQLEPVDLRYSPVGGGAYHWTVQSPGSAPKFLTCDDLDNKEWLGLGRERNSVFESLSSAYRTALSLRSAGNHFVIAPIPTTTGAPSWRLDDRHSLALFEFVDGRQGQWGEPLDSCHHAELLDAIIDIHGTALIDSGLRRRPLDIPGRDGVEDALRSLNRTWTGGPLSEAAREELSRGSGAVRVLFEEFDDLVRGLPIDDNHLVVTHGEPHPGNVIYTGNGPALIDWDTVALAPPERDLWMIAEIDRGLLADYERRTGNPVDTRALRAWRLVWALSDLAAFTALLRGPHDEHADARRSLVALRLIIAGTEPRPYG